MLKSLKLLKKYREIFLDVTAEEPEDFDEIGINFVNQIDEAIAELEEAMKPKTCDGCKQSYEPNNQTFHKYFCEYLKIPIHGDFYCNRYKPKVN